MKIIEIIYSLSSGGAERFVVDLSNEFVARGNEVILCTLLDDKVRDRMFYSSELDRKIEYINLGYEKLGISCMLNIYKLINKYKPDVVHMHLTNVPILCLFAILFLRRSEYVVTCHNQCESELYHSKLPFIKKWLFKLGLYRMIAISDANAESIRQCYGKASNALIYNGRKCTPVSTELNKVKDEIRLFCRSNDTVVFLNIARCASQKNHKRLVRCFNKFIELGYDAILLIIGSDFNTEYGLKLQADACDSIYFLGQKHNVSDYLSLSDVFVLSSDFEGMPITLIEALANVCVPAGTPVSGIVDFVEDGVNGFVSSCFTDESFIELLVRSCEKYKLINKVRLIETYNDKLSISICANKYLSFFDIKRKLSKGDFLKNIHFFG